MIIFYKEVFMGTGIAAAIPVTMGPYKEEWPITIGSKDFSENFFINYDFYK
jgi:hypothetical protein